MSGKTCAAACLVPANREGGTGRPALTARQLECLVWISRGKSSTDVGDILNISPRTVDYHVNRICRQLEVRTRMQAVAHAVLRGWLTAPTAGRPFGSVDAEPAMVRIIQAQDRASFAQGGGREPHCSGGK